MKALILVVSILISVFLLIVALLPWCAAHLPMQASVVVCCLAAFLIIFGLCGALANELGIY
jgi:hypothetical protein